MIDDDDKEDPPPTLADIATQLDKIVRDLGVLQGNLAIAGKQVHRLANFYHRLEERIAFLEDHVGAKAP